jgi:hypothetical protein
VAKNIVLTILFGIQSRDGRCRKKTILGFDQLTNISFHEICPSKLLKNINNEGIAFRTTKKLIVRTPTSTSYY